jgi:hypothetical protein
MTTATTSPVELVPMPALTCDEVIVALACPLCAMPVGQRCEHELARMRVAVRWAMEANAP